MTGRLGAHARWLVPLALASLIAAVIGLAPVVTASAPPSLPSISVAALLAKLVRVDVPGLSGTLRVSADLGLPQLPAAALGGSASPLVLLSGSHTGRVWYAGADRVRLQLFGTAEETDLIRQGRDLWTYTSRTNAVTHTRLPAGQGTARLPLGTSPFGLLTPGLVATVVLRALSPSTAVTVGSPLTVAGRPCHQLQISPRSAVSLVGRIAVAVDSETGAPLRVSITARGHRTPALALGFTDVDLGRPAGQHFTFRPPRGAAVAEQPAPSFALNQGPAAPRLIGTGWDAVLELPHSNLGRTANPLRQAASPVAGGRLLRTALLSALLTNDGRLYLGAVAPQTVLSAARR